MAAFIVIVLGAACVFYVYALTRFGREIGIVRSQRIQAVALVVPFRSAIVSPTHAQSAETKVAVLTANGGVRRDVA
jgi:hypothetical protein